MAESSRGYDIRSNRADDSTTFNSDALPPGDPLSVRLPAEDRRASLEGFTAADANLPTAADAPSVMGALLSRTGLPGLRSASSGSSSISSSGSPGESPAGVIGLTFTSASLNEPPEYSTPIVGYEVMEERARFTIFKVKVEHQLTGRHWFVFRRYTDFLRLNRKLKALFPGLRFALPPKRWFGDNFDPLFLEDRLIGLQAFVNNLMVHKEISKSEPVSDFFCLEEPAGPFEGIEESRAFCESLEERMYRMQHLLKDKDKEVELLRAEISMLRSQQQALLKSLKMQCTVSSLALSRLSAARSMSSSLDSTSSNGSKEVRPLGDLLKVHCFNLAFGQIVERAITSLNDSGIASKTVLDKVSEESSTNCEKAQATSAAAQFHELASQKTFSLEEISSRSTGDGSTGSNERLAPVGGATEPIFRTETLEDAHILVADLDDHESQNNKQIAEIPRDSVEFSGMLEGKVRVDRSTPKKCAIVEATSNKLEIT